MGDLLYNDIYEDYEDGYTATLPSTCEKDCDVSDYTGLVTGDYGLYRKFKFLKVDDPDLKPKKLSF